MRKLRNRVLIFIFAITLINLYGCSSNTKKNDNNDKVENINQGIELNVVKDSEDELDEAHNTGIGNRDSDENIKLLDNETGDTESIDEKELVKLSSEGQKEINIFLSNFTEVFLPDFNGTPTSEMLINFGVRHNVFNNWGTVQIKGSYRTLEKSRIERSVKKYFGLNIGHEETDQYGFDQENYIIELASGETLPMAVVEEMYDNKDGSYTVHFIEVFSHEFLDYSITPQKLKEEINNNPDRTWIGNSKIAIVEDYKFEGKSTYKLLNYVTIVN